MRGVSTPAVALLLAVSILWALSFGLIKTHLAGVDPSLVAAVRLALAILIFLPFWRPRALPMRATAALAAIGALQFGVMYIAYLHAFAHLGAYEVALLTIFTPLFVWILEDVLARRFTPRVLAAAALAVAGAGAVMFRGDAPSGTWLGVLWIQASNFCFAAGQVAYRRVRAAHPGPRDHAIFATLFLGALLVTVPAAAPALADGLPALSGRQWLVLVYLGTIASGVGFFLWNVGATRVGAGTLAAFNNAKVPLGMAASVLVFGEKADTWRLLLGGALIIAALWVAERRGRTSHR
jgi:drug/metabolite transporter (DMT)-like permease